MLVILPYNLSWSAEFVDVVLCIGVHALSYFILYFCLVPACPTLCTRELVPVCGTNVKNYDNECLLHLDRCWSDSTIRLAYPGKCRGK